MSDQGSRLPAPECPDETRLAAGRAAPDAPGSQPGPSWYLRSLADRDTHLGALNARGVVVALCGAEFPLSPITFGGAALPGPPVDPDQICPECHRRGADHGSVRSGINTGCGESFPARSMVRIDLPVGDSPPDDECQLLGSIRDALRGSWANVAMTLSWLALFGLAVYVYVVWPR